MPCIGILTHRRKVKITRIWNVVSSPVLCWYQKRNRHIHFLSFDADKKKRGGKIWIRIFPDIVVSEKPAEVRMGKGKGSPEFWACRVKPGRILFEVDGVAEEIAREALYKASAKLPIKTKFVKR